VSDNFKIVAKYLTALTDWAESAPCLFEKDDPQRMEKRKLSLRLRHDF
jgi:hypothetical protein